MAGGQRWVSLHDVLEEVSQREVDDPDYPRGEPHLIEEPFLNGAERMAKTRALRRVK